MSTFLNNFFPAGKQKQSQAKKSNTTNAGNEREETQLVAGA